MAITTPNSIEVIPPPIDLGAFNYNGETRQLSLIYKGTTADGKVYYVLDANGDGVLNAGSVGDQASHNWLDGLLNGGLDTTVTADQPQEGVDTPRSVLMNGYTLILPTVAELKAHYNDPLPNEVPNQPNLGEWFQAADLNGDRHSVVNLATGVASVPAGEYSPMSVMFQVLGSKAPTLTLTNLTDTGAAGDKITHDNTFDLSLQDQDQDQDQEPG